MNSPLRSYLHQLRMSMAEEGGMPIKEMIIEVDRAPMLPASFSQSISFDPDCLCEFDARFGEERWGSRPLESQQQSWQCGNNEPSHHESMVSKSTGIGSPLKKGESSPQLPRRKASLDSSSFPDYMSNDLDFGNMLSNMPWQIEGDCVAGQCRGPVGFPPQIPYIIPLSPNN
jgi:hypothetical protein